MSTQIGVLYRAASLLTSLYACLFFSFFNVEHRPMQDEMQEEWGKKHDTATGSSRLSSGVMIMMCARSAFLYSFIFWSVSVVMGFPLGKRSDLCEP